MIIYIKNLIKSKIKEIGFSKKTLIKIHPRFDLINRNSKNVIAKYSFGSKNPNKKFYVIKRTPGGGFFSNLLYVILNLKIANKKKYIPVVDMCNFPTNYNQKKNIYNKKNIWDLFFDPVSKYDLDEVYKSQNVYFSPTNLKFRLEKYKKPELKKIFDRYIKVNKKVLNTVKLFEKKNFKNKKVLGIHFRGTDQKIAPNHAHPPTIFEIESLIQKKIVNGNFEKFFLLTEDLSYYKYLKKKYKNFICSYDYFRAKKTKEFSTSSRNNHRNTLGFENLIEAITLSKCDEIVFCESNIPLFAIFYSNFKITINHIDNGDKSSNILIARFSWYLSVYFPQLIKHYLSIPSKL